MIILLVCMCHSLLGTVCVICTLLLLLSGNIVLVFVSVPMIILQTYHSYASSRFILTETRMDTMCFFGRFDLLSKKSKTYKKHKRNQSSPCAHLSGREHHFLFIFSLFIFQLILSNYIHNKKRLRSRLWIPGFLPVRRHSRNFCRSRLLFLYLCFPIETFLETTDRQSLPGMNFIFSGEFTFGIVQQKAWILAKGHALFGRNVHTRRSSAGIRTS